MEPTVQADTLISMGSETQCCGKHFRNKHMNEKALTAPDLLRNHSFVKENMWKPRFRNTFFAYVEVLDAGLSLGRISENFGVDQ